MTDRDVIHQYLKSLSKYLSRLDKSDADDVIREIESHIHDVLESQDQEGLESDAQTILSGFGQPRELAAQYVEHILEGAPPPKGFNAIQSVKRGVSKGLYYTMAFFGYTVSIALIVVALAKPFVPERVGIWLSGQGHSFVIGVLDNIPEGTRELLGWWIIPFALCFGIGIFYLTRRVLAALR